MGSILGDRYELVRHIARGGMGDVYEALDQRLQRRVAVKIYRAASPADRGRFDDEVRVLAGLHHPGLVRVFDAGPHGDDAFVVLELIDGPPLSQTMRGGEPVPPARVAQLGMELTAALAHIHERGVVHRDVTPANVLCDADGHPRLVDFGIVRLLGAERMTSESVAIGTAAYMAPEQVQGHDVSPAADIYALGLLLLELLTGRREFVGSVQEVAIARLVRPPDTTTGVPQEWRSLLHRMCDREPTVRPTAAEVGRALASLTVADSVLLGGVSGSDDRTAPMALPVPNPAGGENTAVLDAGLALTQPLWGDTAVHPAVNHLVDVPEATEPDSIRSRRRLWAALAGLAIVVAGAALAGAGFDSGGLPSGDPLTSTTIDGADGSKSIAPSSTSAPTTTLASTTAVAEVVIDPSMFDEDFPFGEDKRKGPKAERDD